MKRKLLKLLSISLGSIISITCLSGCSEIGEFFSELGSIGNSMANDIKSWAEDTGSNAKSWTEEAGSNVKSWAEDAGSNVKSWAEDAGSVANDIGSHVGSIAGEIGNACQKAYNWLTTDGFDAISDAYGTAKDGVIYAYKETEKFITSTYNAITNKANKLVEKAKNNLVAMESNKLTGYTDFIDYQPESTIESESGAYYLISKRLVEKGYNVLKGAIAIGDDLYGGFIYTKYETVETDEETLFEGGFIQLVPGGFDGKIIDESLINESMIAVSYPENEKESEPFLISLCESFDNFAGVVNDSAFECNVINSYAMSVSFFEKSTYISDITSGKRTAPGYVFDLINNVELKYSKNESKDDYDRLMESKNATAVNRAVETNNCVSELIEHSDKDVQSLAVLEPSLLEKICQKTSSGFKSVKNYMVNALSNVEINGSPIVSMKDDGVHVLDNENAMDSVRTAKGFVGAIGSGLMTLGVAKGIIATIAVSGSGLLPFIVLTTGTCAIAYNVSNMISGLSDVYYGAKGSESESLNPVLTAFKKFIPDSSQAELIYHIWGAVSSVSTLLCPSAANAISISKTNNAGAFQTFGAVLRATFTSLGKIAVSAVAAIAGATLGGWITQKLTGSESFGILVGFGTGLLAAGLTYKGLNKIDEKFDISGLYPRGTITDSNGVKHYWSDDHVNYRNGDKLVANAKFKINNITFKTDSLGRKVEVSGHVSLRDGGRQVIQDSLTKIGEGWEHTGDDRGHLIADYLGGTAGKENLIPQNSNLNRGEYKSFELELAKMSANGKDVSYNIKPEYDGNSFRPFQIIYEWFLDGIAQVPRVFMNL